MSLHCSGYGELWDDIQNVQENDKDGSVHGVSVSSEEAEGSQEASELERKEECRDWKSEEEELGDEDHNTEDKDEDYKGTTCICVVSDVYQAASLFDVMEAAVCTVGRSRCLCRAQRKHPNTPRPDFLTSLFITSNTDTAVYLESVTHNSAAAINTPTGVQLKIVPFLSHCNLNGCYKECIHVDYI